MRKTIFTFFLVLAASAGTLFAESGTCGENLTWDLTDGVLTISGTGTMTNWSSPSSVPWDSYRGNITSVTIGDGVTSIGEWAFYDCYCLRRVTIGNSVTSIGEWAFYHCYHLTSVTIPNSVTSIGKDAFSGCSGLTSIEIPNSVISIGDGAFKGCTGLTSVTLPNSVTSIGDDAFYDCTGLTSLTIGNSVTSIGDYAFSSCTSLISITIPENIQSIGESSFSGCNGLQSVIWNAINCTINYDSYYPPFQDCTNITSFTIGDKVKTIPQALCHGLPITSIDIPNSVTSIGGVAFEYCTSLTSVTIGNSVTSIGGGAFYGCSNLTSIIIPNSVTSIGGGAFYGCTSLISITIPENIQSIGESSFSGCNGLQSVIWNAINCTINYDSYYPPFQDCTNITSFTIGDKVKTIPQALCHGLPITSIDIPNSVTSIGGVAFEYCTSLTSVTIGNSVENIGYDAFEGCTALTSVTLNSNAIVSRAYIWSSNLKHIFGLQVTDYIIGEDVTSIGDYAFYKCYALTSITIPNSVTSIGKEAFCDCSGLTSVTIGNSVTSIGKEAFAYCSGLKSVPLPNSVTSIGDRAFSGCTGLTEPVYNNYLFARMPIMYAGEYTVKDGIQVICSEAFGGCSELTKIKLPSSLKIINGEAFSSCSKLTSLDIPEGVTSLGSMIVNGCFSLQTIKIPKTVNTLLSNTYSSNGYGSVFPFLGINIGKNGFWEEGALTAFIVDPENPIFVSKDGVLYDKNMTKLLQFPCAKKDAYTIPSTVMYIDDYAFYGNQVLTEINLPRNVRVIGDIAFALANLKKVHLPEELVKIGMSSFNGCYNIEELTFGSKIKSIGESAFTLDINKCKSITCFAEQVPTLEKNAFRVGKITGTIGDRKWENMPSSALTVYVPQASIGDYVVDENWSQFTILPISAEPVSVDEIIVTPSETTAEVVWPVISGAATYELVIKDKNGNVICTLVFNAQGQLTQIAFNAPARSNASQQTQSAGFSFTVTGLESGTSYDLTMTAKDGNGATLQEKTMSFKTTGDQAIDEISTDKMRKCENAKIMRDGVLYIERDGEIYNTQGARVE